MTWKRPENIPYPNIWATFRGKPHGDQEPIQYKIQDLTEDLTEGAIEHMVRYYIVREEKLSSSGYSEDSVSVNELNALWREMLKQRMGLICLATDPESGEEKIAGVNMTCISEKDEKSPNFKGKLMDRVWKWLTDLKADIDIFEKYHTNVYMSTLGLSVAPQYHGDNVGYQLLMARTPLCLAAGIPVTITPFTGAKSQYLAKKSGFSVIAQLDFKKYKQYGKLAYPRLDCTVKLMVKEIKTSQIKDANDYTTI